MYKDTTRQRIFLQKEFYCRSHLPVLEPTPQTHLDVSAGEDSLWQRNFSSSGPEPFSQVVDVLNDQSSGEEIL